MKIVCIETVFGTPSVALFDGENVDLRMRGGVREGAKLGLVLIDELLSAHNLRPCDIDAWAFCRGPGAFSGIRIGASIVQGLCVATNAKAMPISSLALLAQGYYAHQKHPCLDVWIDARMDSVYHAQFTFIDGVAVINTPERVLDVSDGNPSLPAVAFGDLPYPIPQYTPNAKDMIPLACAQYANAVSAKDALPVYLREDGWKTLAEQGKSL